jgi:hypothetical protein
MEGLLAHKQMLSLFLSEHVSAPDGHHQMIHEECIDIDGILIKLQC